MIHRRKLLIGAVTLAPAIYLGGCTTIAKAASDADVIANGISAVLPGLQTVLGVGTDLYNKVSTAITNIEQAASGLDAAVAGTGASLAQKLETGIQTVATLLQNVSVPSWVTKIVGAAQLLAPVVATAAGLLGDNPHPPSAQDIALARATLIAAASLKTASARIGTASI